MVCNTPEEVMMEIEVFMTRHKIKKQELASLMNKQKQSVTQIFDHRNPKLDTLFQICDALGIEIELKSKDGN